MKEKKRFLFLKTGAHEDSEGMKDRGKWREKDIAYRWATDLFISPAFISFMKNSCNRQ